MTSFPFVFDGLVLLLATVGRRRMLIARLAAVAAAGGSQASGPALASGLQVGYRLLVRRAVAGIRAVCVTLPFGSVAEERG